MRKSDLFFFIILMLVLTSCISIYSSTNKNAAKTLNKNHQLVGKVNGTANHAYFFKPSNLEMKLIAKEAFFNISKKYNLPKDAYLVNLDTSFQFSSINYILGKIEITVSADLVTTDNAYFKN